MLDEAQRSASGANASGRISMFGRTLGRSKAAIDLVADLFRADHAGADHVFVGDTGFDNIARALAVRLHDDIDLFPGPAIPAFELHHAPIWVRRATRAALHAAVTNLLHKGSGQR